ncbi:MAG: cation transporter, partial [Spirochaetia bacterium]
MAGKRATIRFLVDGMSCSSCEQRIEKALRALEGVHQVSARASLSEVTVYYDAGSVTREMMVSAISVAGYSVRPDSASAPGHALPAGEDKAAARSKSGSLYRFLGLIAVVAAIYLIIRYTVGFTFLPTVTQSMGYGLIFVVGLLTSLHCIAMCGGI